MNKICSRCKQTKSKNSFYKRKESKDGLRSECISCNKNSNNKHSQNKPCPQCGNLCWSKVGVCNNCKKANSYAEYEKLTLGDKTYNKHKYAKYSYVRYYAKRKANELGWKKCVNCEYDKHIKVCHIKPISSYGPDTLLTTINDENNLIPLCPNCHWEFDNGLLKL